ncbi:MAG: hypothetical protein Q8S00_27250 [Deltaproteobacteria bacterium]|nr:hypothetical protein [Deltaproteobacteria bacterium]MDZ4343423.1 hypothetical protein [Candidatus Binatia bacterium]
MRNASGALLVVALILFWAPRAELAGIEPVGKVSIQGGAEKEDGYNAGGRGTIELLGVMPVAGNFGLQGIGHYVGGLGSRFGLSAGPIFSWGSGKAGLFVAYQYRTLHDNNFVHLRPSVAFYLNQANINLYYSHPISSPQRDHSLFSCFPFTCRRTNVENGINHLEGTFSYFPGFDLASFLRKDNLEITIGVQGNSFGGPGSGKTPNGVGPVFGVAFMPMKGVEVNLVKGTIDNHGRYNVLAGLSFYFDKAGDTLKMLRRRYLEPNQFAPNAGSRRSSPSGPVVRGNPCETLTSTIASAVAC